MLQNMKRLKILLCLVVLFTRSMDNVHAYRRFPSYDIDDPDHCTAMKKYFSQTSSENFQRAHYEALESCLFYNLSLKADKDQNLNLTRTLSRFAPTKNGQKVKVFVSDAMLTYIAKPIYNTNDLRIKGWLNTSWNEPRLRWDPNEWNLEKMKIAEMFDIWMPSYNRRERYSHSYGYASFKEVWVNFKGQVWSAVEFDAESDCETDYKSYPMNVHRCCGAVGTQLPESPVEYILGINTVKLNTEKYPSSALVKDIVLKIDSENQFNEQTVQICLAVTMFGSAERTKLMLPVVITVLFVVVAPLFGSMKSQIHAKMFALLLQFLCFQFLIESSPKTTEMGDVTPKIFSFYEFTIGMTIISLLVTLAFRALNGTSIKIPPSHRLKLMASLINKYWFFSNIEEEANSRISNGAMVNGGHLDESIKFSTNAEEWNEIFKAMHNVISLSLIILYVLISLVINA